MSAATFDATGFGALLEIEGTVAERPVVRTKPVGETGEPMPVLCLKVHQVGPQGNRSFTCEQIFPIGQHAAAHARAAQLKPGLRIKVQVALDLAEYHFPVTAHISAVKTQATPNQAQEAAMHEVLISLRSVGPARVVVATTMAQPQVGRKITHPEALALDMITHAKHQPNCARVEWDQALTDADGQAALSLTNDLLSPEMYGYSVSPEVRNAARRVLGIKGREGLAA